MRHPTEYVVDFPFFTEPEVPKEKEKPKPTKKG